MQMKLGDEAANTSQGMIDMPFLPQPRRGRALTIDADVQWAMWAFLAGFAVGLALHFF